ncbi:MAG: formate dehydrogenase accessory sulfurtransferase FdhD [Actinobacteria bacterium]|nr:formate dehydrogenase accessory sulfurtransferase FdhD [Actinomycetota bacterium]MBM3712371.1 formate dehydrogenase accessory sulfurtransferase FdhD [Actinomycetota bacterium]
MDGKVLKSGRKIRIKKIKASEIEAEKIDIIPSELLLTIYLNNISISTISCSPFNLIEMTIGFLINNGYVDKYSDINLLKICNNENNETAGQNKFSRKIEVFTTVKSDKNVILKNQKYISSACGSIDDFVLGNKLQKIKSNVRVNSEVILKLNIETLKHQKHKKAHGGLHSAALFDKNGSISVIMEDIGRHNCIDKITGHILTKRLPINDKIIFTTGRLSLDIIYKISKMLIPVIVTNSSITYSAAIMARKLNLTAIGYARGGRFNIYSCPRRVT